MNETLLTTEWVYVLAYLLLGAIGGVLAGLLGIGGGIVIVPALYLLFVWQGFSPEYLMQLAVATSLATIIFTAMASTRAHHQRGAVVWSAVRGMVPGIVAGTVIGGLLAYSISSQGLRMLFGIFEILVAIQLLFAAKPPAHRQLPGHGGQFVAGGVIGSLSALFGIGGGTLTVPYLLWCNIAIHKAVATAAACGLPIALAATLTFIIIGWQLPGLPAASTGFVYWPAAVVIMIASIVTAPLGARLAHALPVLILKRVFAVVLLVVGLRMIF